MLFFTIPTYTGKMWLRWVYNVRQLKTILLKSLCRLHDVWYRVSLLLVLDLLLYGKLTVNLMKDM